MSGDGEQLPLLGFEGVPEPSPEVDSTSARDFEPTAEQREVYNTSGFWCADEVIE